MRRGIIEVVAVLAATYALPALWGLLARSAGIGPLTGWPWLLLILALLSAIAAALLTLRGMKGPVRVALGSIAAACAVTAMAFLLTMGTGLAVAYVVGLEDGTRLLFEVQTSPAYAPVANLLISTMLVVFVHLAHSLTVRLGRTDGRNEVSPSI